MRFPKQTSLEGKKNFYKRDYVKATQIITPKFYFEEDEKLFGTGPDVVSEVINSHLNIAKRYSSVITSGVGGIQCSSIPYNSISSVTGLAQFFCKQNNLTNIDANDFERNILLPLGKSFRDFSTSSQFRAYLVSSLLPSLKLNVNANPVSSPIFTTVNGAPLRDGTYNNLEDIENQFDKRAYLITNLSWLYFLNISGTTYDGSTIVADLIMNTLWRGKEINLSHAMKALTEYVFRNWTARTDWHQYEFLPQKFRPNLTIDQTNTSGLQQLEKLKTIIDIVYSQNFSDRADDLVKTAFEDYVVADILQNDIESQGPFHKYLKAISYAFSDYNNSVELLEFLNDPSRCPDQFLPYIANFLGWTLIGSEPQKWRLQLFNCVGIYKKLGTKQALQNAIESTFSQDLFDASSDIKELWESYVPHLIYYSLATESPFFKDFTTWTRIDADRLGVTYIPSSLDDCMRCAVDKIILDTAETFNFKFWVRGKQLSYRDPECVFHYRGRDIKVPPFEEYLYYLKQELDVDIINYIIDLLINCYRVPEAFAYQVRNYLILNSLGKSDDYSLGYQWLFFTSSAVYAPNWNSVILDISNKKSDYLSLWNGKSSHFKIFIDASSFTFIKDSILINSIEGLRILNQIIDEFTPAHAVRQTFYRLSHNDFQQYRIVDLPYLLFDIFDAPQLNESDTLGFANYEASGNNLNFYKRGQTAGYNIVSRTSTDSLVDPLNQTNAIIAPRKSFRRRNYENILPKEGLYTRTGYNMPTTFDMVVPETSLSSLGFLALGLIPSAQVFIKNPLADIEISATSYAAPSSNNMYESWRVIHPIYDICEGLKSTSIFSGLIVSSTFPCRGLKEVDLEAASGDYTVDRGQLNTFMRIMHYIGNRKTYMMASAIIDANPSLLLNNPPWLNLIESLANKITNDGGGFPNSFDDYENFSFGRDFHRLHRDYCVFFFRHDLNKRVIPIDGPNIFAHALGSIYRNSTFDTFGSSVYVNSAIVTKDLSAPYYLAAGESMFPLSGGAASGAFILSSPSSFKYTNIEIANSSIFEGVDLIHTYGGNNNYFQIFKLNPALLDYEVTRRIFTRSYPNFTKENVIVKIRNEFANTLPRIRYDLKTYVHKKEQDHVLDYNFLIPEHNFRLDLNVLGCNDELTEFGRNSFGVLIHTSYEKNGTWVFAPNNKWEFVPIESLTVDNIRNNYSHIIDLSNITLDVPRRFCTDTITENRTVYDLDVSAFTKVTLKFNTKNQPIAVPEFYYTTYEQVHRKDQNYFIEIFALDHPTDSIYIDYINIVDMTLNKWSKPLVSGINTSYPLDAPSGHEIGDFYKKQYRVDLTKEHLYDILRFFTEITGTTGKAGLATRIGSLISNKFEANGGSRLNYRLEPLWLPNTTVDFGFGLINALYIEN